MQEQLLSTSEAAKILGVKPRTMSKWRKDNTHPDLVYIQIGSRVRYRKEDLKKWLDAHSVGGQ